MKELKTKFDLSVNAYDELFMTDEMRAENRLPKIYDLPIPDIDDFPEHPYKVQDNEDMELLTESIRERGILSPVTVRKKEDGRYEMISGHRRKHACERLGLKTIRAEIVEMTREDAVIAMVDSNCHRSEILPSEKAFAYKMKLEAMSHQGVACGQSGHKSRDSISDADSGRTVQRYIRLTYLAKPILELVDNKAMAMGPAVEISYLEQDDQLAIYDILQEEDVLPSLSQARQLHELSDEGFDIDIAYNILTTAKPNQTEYYRFPVSTCSRYFPERTQSEMNEIMEKALHLYRSWLIKEKSR